MVIIVQSDLPSDERPFYGDSMDDWLERFERNGTSFDRRDLEGYSQECGFFVDRQSDHDSSNYVSDYGTFRS